MPGLLRIRGSIDLEQFWPNGESDADTSKVKVTVDDQSFSFAADGKSFKRTKAFVGAAVRGASHDLVIDKQNRITVRLQGVDAPELHYRAGGLKRSRPDVTDAKRAAYNAANRVQRRQYWAESATVALAKKLGRYGVKSIRCRVVSLIDHPYEVIDTYGRFVGNIGVGPQFATDINVWLAKEGWVYPTFYSSMTVEEIETLLAAMKSAQKKKRVWSAYSTDGGKFDPKLVYRPKGPVEAAQDKGPVLMPKLFRRQVAYRMQKAAGLAPDTFADFLKDNPDPCYETGEFLAQGLHTAPERKLHEFVKGSKILIKPHEVVFREKFSTLVDAQGQVIEKF